MKRRQKIKHKNIQIFPLFWPIKLLCLLAYTRCQWFFRFIHGFTRYATTIQRTNIHFLIFIEIRNNNGCVTALHCYDALCGNVFCKAVLLSDLSNENWARINATFINAYHAAYFALELWIIMAHQDWNYTGIEITHNRVFSVASSPFAPSHVMVVCIWNLENGHQFIKWYLR